MYWSKVNYGEKEQGDMIFQPLLNEDSMGNGNMKSLSPKCINKLFEFLKRELQLIQQELNITPKPKKNIKMVV